jgi:hypothetical protein
MIDEFPGLAALTHLRRFLPSKLLILVAAVFF